jgi:putative signal transducing protein
MSAEGTGAPVRPLACPRCARKYPLSERFCADCGMPLVYVGRGEEHPITETHERARKIKPQYTGGRQLRVASASNLAEAEMIQGILLEEGIPSFQRRSRGFDVPDFLAAGPRDILVPEAGFEAARELLAQTPVSEQQALQHESVTSARPLLLLGGIVAALAIAVALAWLLLEFGT